MKTTKELSEKEITQILREWFAARGMKMVGDVFVRHFPADRPFDSETFSFEVEVEEKSEIPGVRT